MTTIYDLHWALQSTIVYWARLWRNTRSGKSIPDLDLYAINY